MINCDSWPLSNVRVRLSFSPIWCELRRHAHLWLHEICLAHAKFTPISPPPVITILPHLWNIIPRIHSRSIGSGLRLLPLCFVLLLLFVQFHSVHLLPLYIYIALRRPIQHRKLHLHPVTTPKCLALRFSWRWNVWSYTATHGIRLVCCLQRPFKRTK